MDAEKQPSERLTHLPILPVRDLLPEQIFHSEWVRIMFTPVPMDSEYDGPADAYQLGLILSDMAAPITDRLSRVLASVVVWLGTNCGGCFIYEARKLSEKGVRHAFLAQWAMENLRAAHRNGGRTLIEHCCSTKLQQNYLGFVSASGGRVSVSDIEATNHLMAWLGNDEGTAFLRECERKIAVQSEIKRLGLSESSVRRLGVSA